MWVMWDSADVMLYPLKTPPPCCPKVLEVPTRHDHSIILPVGFYITSSTPIFMLFLTSSCPSSSSSCYPRPSIARLHLLFFILLEDHRPRAEFWEFLSWPIILSHLRHDVRFHAPLDSQIDLGCSPLPYPSGSLGKDMLGVVRIISTIPISRVGLLPDPTPVLIENSMSGEDLHYVVVNPPFPSREGSPINLQIQLLGLWNAHSILHLSSATLIFFFFSSIQVCLSASPSSSSLLLTLYSSHPSFALMCMDILPVNTHSAPCDTVLYAVDVLTSVALWALIIILLFFSLSRVDAQIGAAYNTTDSQIP